MDKALEILREFAGKVGSTAEAMWPLAVANYRWEAIGYLVMAGGWMILLTIAWVCWTRYYITHRPTPGEKWKEQDGANAGIVFTVLSTLTVLSIMIIARSFPASFANAIEPAGGLLREILK